MMRHAKRKHWDLHLKIFSALLMEPNRYLPLFPVSSASKKMSPDELNEILPQAVPKTWSKQAYI